MSRAIAFRPASESDLSFLYALHSATMKNYVDQTWGWEDAFQESFFRKNFAPAAIQIITVNGEDAGMLSIEERDEDVFLRAIEIHPEYQGKGIGTTLIKSIVADGTRKNKPVHLRVLKVNPTKRLYDRQGFSTIEETDTHYIMLTSMP